MAEEVIINIEAAGYARNQTIVETELQHPLAASTNYKVLNANTGSSAFVQHIDDTHIAFILPDVLGDNEVATYKLVEAKPSEKAESIIAVDKNERGLQVKIGGKDLLFYHTAVLHPPEPVRDIYSRSGFIHPLTSPAGKILTDDFPAGHAHHHGIMMAWTSTVFKNVEHDFWNQSREKGNVRHLQVENIEIGPVISFIRLKLQQYSYVYGEVLNELWTLKIYPFSEYFLFDLCSDQKNTTSDPLILNKFNYGGLSFRASKDWNPQDPVNFKNKWAVFTDSHPSHREADGKPAAYVSASGSIDGSVAGVTVFGFPENYNYPQPVRVHPSMPYWCFAPTVNEGFSIKPGDTYRSKYRYYVHDESPDKTVLDGLNNDLVHPVKTSVVYK